MDRLINIKISGSHLSKDSKLAGVRGEANVNVLRITFDEGWDAYTKKVTFWDAKGQNPVERILTADLLEDITKSTLIYLCPIPGEPMAEAGMMSFIIDGYAAGKRPRSMGAELEVEYAPLADNAGQPADPTPSQAEQLQRQIDVIKEDVQKAAQGAQYAEQAIQYAADAKACAEAAASSKESAAQSETNAAESADRAEAALNLMGTNAEDAARSAAAAETAQAAAESANATAQTAKTAAESAKAAAEAARAGAVAAKEGLETAASSAGASASAAANSASNAAESEAAAEAAQAAAEKARDEAQQAAGGDFATPGYVDGKASEAESKANAYTDQKFANIPTPDVSGQIGTHNTATDAHADIRQRVETAIQVANSAYDTADAKPEIFLCYLDETSYEEVEEAYQNGNVVMLLNEYELWPLTYAEEYTKYEFSRVRQDKIETWTLDVSEGWISSETSIGVPTDHAVKDTTYGKGTDTLYGHVKLIDSVTDGYDFTFGFAATPLSVRMAYDEAKSAHQAASGYKAASRITAGTFAGQVVANASGQDVGTSLLRNSKLVSADTNPTVNGEICWTYK